MKKRKHDKQQGMVFVLPKSREFFGRISEDFQNLGTDQKIISERTHMVSRGVFESETKAAEKEIASLKEIKANLEKLTELHNRLKTMLSELDCLLEETEESKN